MRWAANSSRMASVRPTITYFDALYPPRSRVVDNPDMDGVFTICPSLPPANIREERS